MSLFGSDVVALGCILGGALVSGTLTASLLHGGEHADAGCAVEAHAMAPSVAISHRDGARSVIVTPDVTVHAVQDCVGDVGGFVEIHMDNHLEDLDLHMGHLDLQMGDLDAQLSHLDRALEKELHQMELQLEREFGQQLEARAEFEEAMRQVEEARVKVVIKKAEGGGD